MKKIQTFSINELTTFINSQLDDRPVDMNQPNGDQDCGCVLVHFGRHYFHRQIGPVSFSGVVNDRNQRLIGDNDVNQLINKLIHQKPKTYGEVKKILKNYI